MAKAETKAEVKANKEPTPEEVTTAARNEEFVAQREREVMERSPERPLTAVAYPTPATSSWVVVPKEYWGKTFNVDDHEYCAVQVVQVHDYPNAPSVVTFRCDHGSEWRVTWDGDVAKAVYEATQAVREAHEQAHAVEVERARDQAAAAAGAGR